MYLLDHFASILPIPVFLNQIMIVCLCNPVTDSQIQVCATDGCGSFREMAAKLGVAQQCGRCAFYAKQVFDAARMATEDFQFPGIRET